MEIKDYVDTNPDEYAGSVYSVPCWMIGNGSKRRKIQSAKPRVPNSSNHRVPTRSIIPSQANSNLASVSQFSSHIPGQVSEIPMLNMKIPGGNVQSAPEKKKTNVKRTTTQAPQMKASTMSPNDIYNPSADGMVDLYCCHCSRVFKAKPTYRKRFQHTLVNHSCSGLKRRQYVLGVKHRKCDFGCSPETGCIYQV